MPLNFKKGFSQGLAIGLGYLSVSFSFGILAVSCGLTWWQAVLISICNLTSAGQVAGVGIMAAGGLPLEMALATLVINMRYALMSISLTQKTDKTMTTPVRAAVSYFITDEVFGVASGNDKPVNRNYMFGLGTLPILGWILGTLLGALCGNILPAIVSESLTIAIYGMFVAIVLPVSKQDKGVAAVSVLAVAMSVVFWYVPFLKERITSGFAIIICSIVSALAGALLKPRKEEKANG